MTSAQEPSGVSPAPPDSIALSALAAATATPEESDLPANVPIAQLQRESSFQGIEKPPTFQQLKGTQLTSYTLFFIFLVMGGFLISWWVTRPSVEDVLAILGQTADGKEKLEALESLRAAHLNAYRDLFQLTVGSVLIPIFTLLTGYAFGARQAETAAGQR